MGKMGGGMGGGEDCRRVHKSCWPRTYLGDYLFMALEYFVRSYMIMCSMDEKINATARVGRELI